MNANMAEDTKNTLALLNGIARRAYYKESEITDEFLKSQIYPDMPQDEFQKLVSRFANLIRVGTKEIVSDNDTPTYN